MALATYPAIADGRDVIIDAPCGCYDCTDGVKSGHFACDSCPSGFAGLEEKGVIHRAYDDGRWRWFLTDPNMFGSGVVVAGLEWFGDNLEPLGAQKALITPC